MAVLGLRGALWAILVSTTVVLSQNLSNNSSPTLKDGQPNLSPKVQGLIKAGVNEPCNSEQDCATGLLCNDWKICTCRPPKKYSWKHKICYEGKKLGESCSYDEECEDKDMLSQCSFSYCKCRFLYVKGTSGCEYDSGVKGTSWAAIVFPILGSVAVIIFIVVCIVRCRSGRQVRGVLIVRSVEIQPAPEVPVVPNYPPPFNNGMPPNQQNAFPPPPPYNERNYQYPGMTQPGTGQVQNPQSTQVPETNRAFVNN